MRKICVLVAESCAGKDTVLNILVDKYNMNRVVSHTTRPMRHMETDGKEYHFTTNEEFMKMKQDNLFVETRQYNTYQDGESTVWRYGVSKRAVSEQINGILVLDLEGLKELEGYLGRDSVVSFYIMVGEKVRMERSLKRGDEKSEVLRRFQDDAIKFLNAQKLTTYTIDNKKGQLDPSEIAEIIFNKLNEECMNE